MKISMNVSIKQNTIVHSDNRLRYNNSLFYYPEIDAKHNYFLLFTRGILVDRCELFGKRWNLAG